MKRRPQRAFLCLAQEESMTFQHGTHQIDFDLPVFRGLRTTGFQPQASIAWLGSQSIPKKRDPVLVHDHGVQNIIDPGGNKGFMALPRALTGAEARSPLVFAAVTPLIRPGPVQHVEVEETRDKHNQAGEASDEQEGSE